MEREFGALKGLMVINGLDDIMPDIGRALRLVDISCNDLKGCKEGCKDACKKGCKDACKSGSQNG